MSKEGVSLCNYYDQGNFYANKRWDRNFRPIGKVELTIPIHIADRINTPEPFEKYDCRLEFGRWEAYKPSPDSKLDPEVLIARSPLHSLQRIVGPKLFIHNIMFAYYLLDMLYPNNTFHNIDLVASVRYGPDGIIQNNGQLLWTDKLLKDAGIGLEGTRFPKTLEDKPTVGITSDKNWPEFLMYHDVRNSSKSKIISSIGHAESIIHDLTHREQERLGYSSVNRSAEIQAISNQLRLGTSLYNHPGFFNPDPFENWQPHRVTENYIAGLKQTSEFLRSFKNGDIGHISSTPEIHPSVWKHKPIEDYLPIIEFVVN